MSSKMLAGLAAGGFGAALSIGLTISSQFSPQLAYFLALTLLFGLGALSGVLAAAWLDLADYGHQHAAGAIVGLVAAGLTEVADLVLRLLFATLSKASPTTMLANLLLSRLPASSDVARILFMIVINLLLYLLYLLVVIGISSAVASFAGRAKTAEALQNLLHVRQSPLPRDPSGEDLLDPALLPFMRPEYSPFVSDAPPVPVSSWQQRRLERGGLPPGKSAPLAGKSSPLPRTSAPLAGKSNPLPRKSGQPPARDERFAAKDMPPSGMRGQPPSLRSQSGKLNPSGTPARGTVPGAAQRRPTPGLRPPSQAQWPRPREKD
ncbi:MAG TPA: hypothetical protein VFU69_14875 [Ktedonobacterales bacterium]|nr:hypothetical protein [Ktedonobacterales bacterium]